MALTAITVYAPPQKPLLGLITVAVIFGAINLPSVGLWALLGVQMRQFLDQPAKMRRLHPDRRPSVGRDPLSCG